MKKGIHMEMAYQVISDYTQEKGNNCLEFFIEGVVSQLWSKKVKENRNERIRQLKEWMDMPDNKIHSSKMSNDHSYKIKKENGKYKIVFAKTNVEQATVLSRLKSAAKDMKEWKEEDEYRVCALEILKSIHWVIDFNSPAHVSSDWSDASHSKSEGDFDDKWKLFYDKSKIKFSRKDIIKDVYKWAKDIVEKNYDRNIKLRKLYEDGKSITDPLNEKIAKEVVFDIAQSLADYLSYCDKKINFNDSYTKLKKVNEKLNK